MGKITGIIKSAEEITGQEECVSFKGDLYGYNENMNKLAGQRVILSNTDHAQYQYLYNGTDYACLLKAGWVKDIQSEVDWSTVPMDAPVIVGGVKFHFAGVSMNPIIIKIWCFGKTSWTINHSDNSFKVNISDVTLAEVEAGDKL